MSNLRAVLFMQVGTAGLVLNLFVGVLSDHLAQQARQLVTYRGRFVLCQFRRPHSTPRFLVNLSVTVSNVKQNGPN